MASKWALLIQSIDAFFFIVYLYNFFLSTLFFFSLVSICDHFCEVDGLCFFGINCVIVIFLLFCLFCLQAKLSAASLIAPSIQHTNLISVTLIENWNLHTCRYCKVITHAQANDSAKTLINPSLWVRQIINFQKLFVTIFVIWNEIHLNKIEFPLNFSARPIRKRST